MKLIRDLFEGLGHDPINCSEIHVTIPNHASIIASGLEKIRPQILVLYDSYYQGAWRLSFRIKDKPAENIKEFQHNYTIHNETKRKTTPSNQNRKRVSLKSLRIFMIGQTHKHMIKVRFMFCSCCGYIFYHLFFTPLLMPLLLNV